MRSPATRARDFLALVEPLRDVLYRHARRAAAREDDAADLVQEAVLVAWREFERFEPGTNFRAWIFRILVQITMRHNRRCGRRREVTLATDDEPIDADPLAMLEREEAWQMLLGDAERLMEVIDDRLARALRALDDTARQCLLLRLHAGFSYREIASILGVPLGTAMSHVHRARLRLREELAAVAVERGWIRGAS